MVDPESHPRGGVYSCAVTRRRDVLSLLLVIGGVGAATAGGMMVSTPAGLLVLGTLLVLLGVVVGLAQ